MVDVVIQHHPSRAELIAPLLAALPSATVVSDPDPAGKRCAWRTYRECLARPVETTHRLVLQDDTQLCRNFLPALDLVIAARPDNPVVLWVGGTPHTAVDRMARACEHGRAFAEWPPGVYVATVAMLWPTALIDPVLKWVESQRYPAEFGADDEILGRAFKRLGVQPLMTVPSLVEHPDEVESIKRNNRARAGANLDRIAWCFADDVGTDPLLIDLVTSRQREAIPTTVEECDRDLAQYREAMRLASRDGRYAVWDQIDRILEIRFLLQSNEVRRTRR